MTFKPSNPLPAEHEAVRKWLIRPAERLSAYRAFYDAGVVLALSDAFDFCERYERRFPDWLVAGIREIIRERIHEGRSVGRGRHGNDAKAARENAIHLIRYLHVQAARDRGSKLVDAYATAAQTLETIRLAASEDTIERSYRKVQEALKSPEKAFKFYPLSPYRLRDQG